MPVQPTYPGVYIEEVASGIRTITGVATSITAFIGRALLGPVNEPVTIHSFGDYERNFGGLSVDSTMSYAVRDFYLNGGGTALIVRIAADDAARAEVELPATADPTEVLKLVAVSEGAWGNRISVSVNHDTADPTAQPPAEGEEETELFNLIFSLDGVKAEEHLNLSLKTEDVRFLPRVLEQNSLLLGAGKDAEGEWEIPAERPKVTTNAIPAAKGKDGGALTDGEYLGSESEKTGLYAFLKADLFNLLCIPPPVRQGDTGASVWSAALALCVKKRAMLLVDSPLAWGTPAASAAQNAVSGLTTLGLSGTDARNAALYFPRIRQKDPHREGQTDLFVPCGTIAGIISKTDAARGVWKSPAGIDTALGGINGLQVHLTDAENGMLNPLGINCLRNFPVYGTVVWGARTMRGANQLADEYKYIAVRRMALFIEESLYRGTKWVVFEPNDEPLWAQIRLNIGAFMHNLFRQGAFQGTTPRDAYLVKCDRETTTQHDINQGIVNIIVGFDPLKPAEFVFIKIQQLSGQIES